MSIFYTRLIYMFCLVFRIFYDINKCYNSLNAIFVFRLAPGS